MSSAEENGMWGAIERSENALNTGIKEAIKITRPFWVVMAIVIGAGIFLWCFNASEGDNTPTPAAQTATP